MRTTVTLADDVAAAVEQFRRERGMGISDAINELVRRGLVVTPARARFRQSSVRMGVPLLALDDVSGLLESLDGVDQR